MVTFELVSAQEVTINGVGLLKAGEAKQVDQDILDHFQAEHGYPLTKANFPFFVKLIAVVTKDETTAVTNDETNKKSKEV